MDEPARGHIAVLLRRADRPATHGCVPFQRAERTVVGWGIGSAGDRDALLFRAHPDRLRDVACALLLPLPDELPGCDSGGAAIRFARRVARRRVTFLERGVLSACARLAAPVRDPLSRPGDAPVPL